MAGKQRLELGFEVPTQKEVTKVMAALVEACHPALPPEEVRPVVLHIVRYFVTEAQAAEVIEVGKELNERPIEVMTWLRKSL